MSLAHTLRFWYYSFVMPTLSDSKGGYRMKMPIDQLNLSGKRTLIRVDFNVPMDKAGN